MWVCDMDIHMNMKEITNDIEDKIPQCVLFSVDIVLVRANTDNGNNILEKWME